MSRRKCFQKIFGTAFGEVSGGGRGVFNENVVATVIDSIGFGGWKKTACRYGERGMSCLSVSSSMARKAGAAPVSAWIPKMVSKYATSITHPGASDIIVRRSFASNMYVFKSAFSTVSGSIGKCSNAVSSLAPGISASERRAMMWWLGGCSAWVASMVVVGGVTRLTRSGLSMTDWKFTGEKPPSSDIEWEEEFARYKRSPEFKKVNSSMTLDEFKYIYWIEWAHRMWGRGLGFAFVLPGAYFLLRGSIPKPLLGRLGLLLAMGGTQGLIGWWMVRSGLNQPDFQYEIPRVSPYRLATHLVSAFAIYGTLLWTTFEVGWPRYAQNIGSMSSITLRKRAVPVAALLAFTAASGAFVAGLDAGHAYNTFPTMNGEWFPTEYWRISGWRNAFENTAAVQFHHRVLALTSVAAVSVLWATSIRLPGLSKSSKYLLHGLLAAVGTQASLGVATLLTYVPVSLGSLHQAGALGLLSIALGLMYNTGSFATKAPSGSILALVLLVGASVAATFGDDSLNYLSESESEPISNKTLPKASAMH